MLQTPTFSHVNVSRMATLVSLHPVTASNGKNQRVRMRLGSGYRQQFV